MARRHSTVGQAKLNSRNARRGSIAVRRAVRLYNPNSGDARTAQLRQEGQCALMGREEKCQALPARRIGNEFLSRRWLRRTQNRTSTKSRRSLRPAACSTLLNESPQTEALRGLSHSEDLARLVDEGRSSPCGFGWKITFLTLFLGRRTMFTIRRASWFKSFACFRVRDGCAFG